MIGDKEMKSLHACGVPFFLSPNLQSSPLISLLLTLRLCAFSASSAVNFRPSRPAPAPAAAQATCASTSPSQPAERRTSLAMIILAAMTGRGEVPMRTSPTMPNSM